MFPVQCSDNIISFILHWFYFSSQFALTGELFVTCQDKVFLVTDAFRTRTRNSNSIRADFIEDTTRNG
jgi:hypothetical protein